MLSPSPPSPTSSLPSPSLPRTPLFLLQSEQQKEELRAEIAALRRVQGHPHITSLSAVYEDEECVHLVMEHCRGGDLFERLATCSYLPESEARGIFR